jgi:uncharacterized spore protein YtfJ
MGVEETIKEIASELERIATTKTVVGEPITAAGKTIIPISRISLGFGAGGAEGRKESESGYGGGGGAGAKVEPVAFIMISEEEARIFRVSERGDGSLLSSLPELLPELMDKLKGAKGKNKKEDMPGEKIVKETEVRETETTEQTEAYVEKGGCFK